MGVESSAEEAQLRPRPRRNSPSSGIPKTRRLSPPIPPPTGAPSPPVTRRAHELTPGKRTQPALPRVRPAVLSFKSAPPLVLPVSAQIASRRPPVSKGVELNRMAEMLAGETLMGRYRIEQPLGRGSTGIVFRAHDLPNNCAVAIKFLDPELSRDAAVVARFRTEALTPTRIASEHVVRVLEADVCPELVPLIRPDDPLAPAVPFLTMELLEGKDLRQYLQERGPLSGPEASEYLSQIAPTLDQAHEVGIVHRDLKPANLFLSRRADGSPLVKVLDFGIAQLADASAARGLGGGLFGTPWYMAPEQAGGEIATAASDRWALGMVAFRLLTGEGYWAPSPIPELLSQILRGPTKLPSEVVRDRGLLPMQRIGSAFDAWFTHACQVDPSRRFATVVEQVTHMQQALETDRASRTHPPRGGA